MRTIYKLNIYKKYPSQYSSPDNKLYIKPIFYRITCFGTFLGMFVLCWIFRSYSFRIIFKIWNISVFIIIHFTVNIFRHYGLHSDCTLTETYKICILSRVDLKYCTVGYLESDLFTYVVSYDNDDIPYFEWKVAACYLRIRIVQVTFHHIFIFLLPKVNL